MHTLLVQKDNRMEEFEHVMECLRDVLRKEKMLQVSEEQVLEELEKTKGLDGEKVNHTYQILIIQLK